MCNSPKQHRLSLLLPAHQSAAAVPDDTIGLSFVRTPTTTTTTLVLKQWVNFALKSQQKAAAARPDMRHLLHPLLTTAAHSLASHLSHSEGRVFIYYNTVTNFSEQKQNKTQNQRKNRQSSWPHLQKSMCSCLFEWQLLTCSSHLGAILQGCV